MEAPKPFNTLDHVLCSERPHRTISDFISHFYGNAVILTGIKDCCFDDVFTREYTFGIPLKDVCDQWGIDLLDYAQNTVVVYDAGQLKETSNGDYEVSDPFSAVLGFVHLTW